MTLMKKKEKKNRMLIRGKICGDHCDRKMQSVNALLSHISKCREILFFHMFTDLFNDHVCSNMCTWNDSGMAAETCYGCILVKVAFCRFAIENSQQFIPAFPCHTMAGISKIIYVKFIAEKTFVCID